MHTTHLQYSFLKLYPKVVDKKKKISSETISNIKDFSVYINVEFQSHKSIVNIIHEKYKYIYYLIDRLV